MHRSGTSAVAGFLAQAGFYAGEEADLLPAAEDNPKGFFEREDVNALNDDLLAELGGAWDKPVPRAVVAERAAAWAPQVHSVLAGLGAEAAGRPLVLKDPRISLVLPAWLPALDSRYTVVLVDRGPMDIALSVSRRDNRPLYVALALWQLYCTELLDGLAGRRVLVVHYENFVADPSGQGRELLSHLAEVLPSGFDGIDAARAAGFVSLDMRHHRTGPQDPANRDVLTSAQLDLARWLAELPEGWTELAPPAELRAQPEAALGAVSWYYDAMADRFGMETAYDLERHKALHFEQATELKDRHIENIEAGLRHLRRQADSQTARIAELEAEAEVLKADNEDLRSELRALHQDGRAAASNLVAVARRSLSGRPAPDR
jgi:hypothetical protein